MFTLKAINGNIDLSVFDLKALTNKANQTAKEIQEHNNQVAQKFVELIKDYIYKINDVMIDELELPSFKSVNLHIGDWYLSRESNGLSMTFEFGHGRASIKINFFCPREGEKLTYDFSGKIIVWKNWKDNYAKDVYPLESVAQVFEVGADVIKVHIIDRDVKDYTRKMELEKMLDY